MDTLSYITESFTETICPCLKSSESPEKIPLLSSEHHFQKLNLIDLPISIHDNIAKTLQKTDLFQLRLTCKTLSNYYNHPSIYKSIKLYPSWLTDNFILPKSCQKLQLICPGKSSSKLELQLDPMSFPDDNSVQKLTLGGSFTHTFFLSVLQVLGPNLTNLTLINVPLNELLSDSVIIKFAVGMPKLTGFKLILDASKSSAINISPLRTALARCQNLTSFQIIFKQKPVDLRPKISFKNFSCFETRPAIVSQPNTGYERFFDVEETQNSLRRRGNRTVNIERF